MSHLPSSLNPFITGNIVPFHKFVGREAEGRLILDHIAKTDNVALVGEPHIGKTSLLRYIATEEIHQTRLPQETKWAFVWVDGSSDITSKTTLMGFLKGVFEQACEIWEDKNLDQFIKATLQETVTTRLVEKILKEFQKKKLALVLILDEFDAMVTNTKLNEEKIWAVFRTIASQPHSFCYIISSRKSLVELQIEIETHYSTGSPPFNIFTEYQLKPFSPHEVDEFFTTYQGDKRVFTPQDIRNIVAISGRHPYLLQLTSMFFWDIRVQKGKITEEDLAQIRQKVVSAAHLHFVDLWRYFERQESLQTAILVLSLKELGIQTHDLKDLDKAIQLLKKAISKLESMGMVENTSNGIRLAGDAIQMWISTNQLPDFVESPKEWFQKNKKIWGGTISQGDMDKISEIVRGFRGIVIETLAELLKGLGEP